MNNQQVLEKVMKETNSKLLHYLPKLTYVERMKVQRIMFDAFLELDIDIKEFKEIYDKVKPCVL